MGNTARFRVICLSTSKNPTCWHASTVAVKICALHPSSRFPLSLLFAPVIVDLRDTLAQQKAHPRPSKGPIPSCLSSKSSRGPLRFSVALNAPRGPKTFYFSIIPVKKKRTSFSFPTCRPTRWREKRVRLEW